MLSFMLWLLAQLATEFHKTCWNLGQDSGAWTVMSSPKAGVCYPEDFHVGLELRYKIYSSLEQQMDIY